MKTKYRIIYVKKWGYLYLQFLHETSFLGVKIKTWRYIPDSSKADVFTKSQAPVVLPFMTCNYFISSRNKQDLRNIANGTDDVQKLFDRVKAMKVSEDNYRKTEFI